MGFRNFFIFSILSLSGLVISLSGIEPPAPAEVAAVDSSQNSESQIHKLHILYLLQKGELKPAIDLYLKYKTQLGRHDFEILQDIGLILLGQGMKGADPKTQLISLFGAHIAGISASIDILESGIKSPYPETQIAAIQFLGKLQDDRSEALLTRAMASDFLYTRMAAAEQLSLRKSRSAVGQIEALMYRIPHQVRFFFPQFFAVIGTQDAITVLKHLMDEPSHMTRIETILSVARLGRDDLLPKIRAAATHASSAEQEASATALGFLKDSKSIPLLETLSQSSIDTVKIAALRSLYLLGTLSAREKLIDLAENNNLFAISVLGSLPGTEDTLKHLVFSSNIQVRINAMIALLERRSPFAIFAAKEFLISDARNLKLQIHPSIGHSLTAWRLVTFSGNPRELPYDPEILSLQLKEEILTLALELPSSDFLPLAEALLEAREYALIPLTVSLLENIQTEEAITLLQKYAKTTGEPLIRTYCQLALFRLKKTKDTPIVSWIHAKKNTEIMRMRPQLPFEARPTRNSHPSELTPEENSRLLIECYQTLSLEHTDQGIDLILDSLKTGHPNNQPILAGLLIQAIQ